MYTCKICGVTFTRTSDLKRHEDMHAGKKGLKCVKCNKAFGRADNLRRHTKTCNSESSTQMQPPVSEVSQILASSGAQTPSPLPSPHPGPSSISNTGKRQRDDDDDQHAAKKTKKAADNTLIKGNVKITRVSIFLNATPIFFVRFYSSRILKAYNPYNFRSEINVLTNIISNHAHGSFMCPPW